MLIGVIVGIGGCLVLLLCVYIGYKLQTKPKVQTQTEQEIEAVKQKEIGFQNIFDYDVNVALGKRVSK